jgi:radical SAM protein with 4Fe4S-binding SPASM domain
MNLLNRLSFTKPKTPAVKIPAAGVYHFLRQTEVEKSRLHLRLDNDGSGLLIINANRVFQLNPTAAAMMFLALNETPADQATSQLRKKFNAPKATILTDYTAIQDQLVALVSNEYCPICDLDLETTMPFSSRPSAPYRMDLAITYRCNNACAHCYNARSRNYPELSTEEWFKILDDLWKIGIPHIVFTGGEPTLRDDLPELIRHAEANGQITGINTNGRKLKDKEYLQKLVDAGLDHVQITFESHVPEIHDQMVCHAGAWQETVEGLKNAVATSLYVMTNTTMLTLNKATIPDTLEFLGQLGLKTIGLNALIYSGHGATVGTGLSESELQPILESAQTITNKYQQRLIWYTPTQYCNFDPTLMGLGIKGCTAALYNMCIEPNGDVIPCQSYYQSLGNFLNQPWDTIWNHDLAVSLRERRNLPEKCHGCSLLSECGGGCPLAAKVNQN